MNTTKNGKPEQVGSVELEPLKTDMTYQRGLKMWQVDDISNDWSDEACGMIIVSLRENGDMYIVDGQHRVAAAKNIGKTHLPARIVEDHTPKQEAQLRLRTNRKKNETAAERFRAQLIAEVPESLAIVKLLRRFKAKLALDGVRSDAITAVSAIERMYRMDEGSTLDAVLRVIHEADGELHAANTQTRVLRSVEWFLRQHHQEMDRKRFTRVLKQSKAAVKQRGTMLAAQMGGAEYINDYRAILEFYNDGLAKAKQLEPITKGYKSVEHDHEGAL